MSGAASRSVCYCRDCQAFARYLGEPARALNAQGGTAIVATLPAHIHLTRGAERLACMRLSDKGMLRWYASCCRTPIGNTPPDPGFPFVGLVEACLPGAPKELDEALGPTRVALNTASANGNVAPTRSATLLAILKIMRNVLGARLRGGHRQTPFFRPGTAEPVATPHVLKPDEHRALRGDA
ncbi:hypothetical protein ASD88_21890 [Pelomonas sp. Root662]|nr:hypothetical protein ASC81_20310 [Pelomonas sp. Root405]KRA68089.1 hypothetical protein ASD88_21890 [Pelomonas sp. Root662]